MIAFALVGLVSFTAFCRYSIIMTFAAGTPGVLQGGEVLPEATRALAIAGAAAGVAAVALLFWQVTRTLGSAVNFPRRPRTVVFPSVVRPS